MNGLLIFGLGILCGFVLTILLIGIFASLKISDIDKER